MVATEQSRVGQGKVRCIVLWVTQNVRLEKEIQTYELHPNSHRCTLPRTSTCLSSVPLRKTLVERYGQAETESVWLPPRTRSVIQYNATNSCVPFMSRDRP